ncbi:hypothetical protein PHYBLDRAFT_173329 [Phycomyces blakesleeanus NRRL 1555(-)]|uniref:Uncharacterized protein n=1 Tax=Phycomyces blakesleeanus (strain ATCC 8743b / DSM 1359 / FGSC 10004 / NBRC 33097 / NRRL 1555) TaxID=763407 RepID=A0A163D2X7_PHYB8|nr:hypothetical protein PHYBLDRAFT_173329 [Phycomyces blakesleeanus NRRL 1555(-)]OAD68330.1 hypothetical protein PHYBLDRAFT_173329 [Phycomyces blakesleeanus NRRL 1555(-)]|eukprot:XP_018286370.1 hypothetical protein PHYBLDRAFT_173329 [Phycomyces blakesleeanus NRRL 1555(-)]
MHLLFYVIHQQNEIYKVWLFSTSFFVVRVLILESLSIPSIQFPRTLVNGISCSLEPNGNNRIMFGNLIRSDGLSIDWISYKMKPNPIASNNYKPVFIDPGGNAAIIAAEKVYNKTYGLLRYKNHEYYYMTGLTRYQADRLWQKKQNGIETIENYISSDKTVSHTTLIDYVQIIQLTWTCCMLLIAVKLLNTRFLYTKVPENTRKKKLIF